MCSFEKKVVIITGGTSGIGEATVKEFAKRGASVVFTGRNSDRGIFLADSLKKEKKDVWFISADNKDDESIHRVGNFIRDHFGRLDVLFNNAGVYPVEPALEEEQREDFVGVFDVNIGGTVMMTKEMLSLLRLSHGSIIFNASIAGLESFTCNSSYAYSGSKAAVLQFSKMLAKKYGKEFRTNCICPGTIRTPIFKVFDEKRKSANIPMERTGCPEEVAKVVCFLASDDASFVNGAVLTIDGGESLK